MLQGINLQIDFFVWENINFMGILLHAVINIERG